MCKCVQVAAKVCISRTPAAPKMRGQQGSNAFTENASKRILHALKCFGMSGYREEKIKIFNWNSSLFNNNEKSWISQILENQISFQDHWWQHLQCFLGGRLPAHQWHCSAWLTPPSYSWMQQEEQELIGCEHLPSSQLLQPLLGSNRVEHIYGLNALVFNITLGSVRESNKVGSVFASKPC